MEEQEEGSYRYSDAIVERLTQNPDFPFFVSFPRTGSHWLRMLMELYFERPSLVRAFYYFDATDFTCYHRHDEDLTVERKSVLYLYREPVETIYSQMSFYKEQLNDRKRIVYWAELYGRHMDKWLYKEKFTTKKTILTYEGLRKNLSTEFEKICQHLKSPFDPQKLATVEQSVTKEKLKKKTTHDPRVLNLSTEYESQREVFKADNSLLIHETIGRQNPELAALFK